MQRVAWLVLSARTKLPLSNRSKLGLGGQAGRPLAGPLEQNAELSATSRGDTGGVQIKVRGPEGHLVGGEGACPRKGQVDAC